MKNVIGINNKIPWSLPRDLSFFRAITMGFPVIVGRKTFNSLPLGYLPGRHTIVLSRKKDLPYQRNDTVTVASSPEEGIEKARFFCIDKKTPLRVFIGGGAEIYNVFWKDATRILLTKCFSWEDGDTFFPNISDKSWIIEYYHRYNFSDEDSHTFEEIIYKRC